MPASPFGLAYGLGAGIAGAQQQMQARQMAAQQMAQQALQQQLLQHQVSQQQAEDEVGQTPIPQQMQSVPTYETQELPTAYSAPGVPFGTETYSQQVQTGTTQKPVEYVTPYQKMAYETAQRAQMVRDRGFSFSADQLDQRAAQLAQQHQMMALQKAGMAFRAGTPNDAVPYLNSVGTNYKSIRESPDDPDTLEITRADGSVGTLSRQQAELLAVKPEDAPMIEANINFKKREMDYWNQKVGVSQDSVNQRREAVAARVQMGNERNETMKAVARIRANASPAEVKSVNAEAANIARMNPDLGPDEAESVAWAQRRLRGTQADPKLKAAINATTHISPYTQNPDEQETLKSARTYINDILKKEPEDTGTTKVKRPKLGPSGDPTQNPGGYLPGDYSKDGKYYLSPVTKKWVPAGSK